MKKIQPLTFFFILAGLFICLAAYSQPGCKLLQVSPAALTASAAYAFTHWFGVMEFPFLFISVFFAFSTSRALKSGRFGKGLNLFNTLLGPLYGSIAWFVALVVTWGLSGLGFYSIYKASRNA